MPTTRTDDGVSIAYRTRGTGPRNLVFLHAWGASGSYFDETIESLDLGAVRAITLDLRGHGDSDKPDTELTWERLARDVFAVADDAAADAAADDFVAVVAAGVHRHNPDPLPAPAGPRARAAAIRGRRGEDPAHLPRADTEPGSAPRRSSSGSARSRVPALVISSWLNPVHSTERDIVTSLPHARLEILDYGPEIPMELPAELAHLIEEFVSEASVKPCELNRSSGYAADQIPRSKSSAPAKRSHG